MIFAYLDLSLVLKGLAYVTHSVRMVLLLGCALIPATIRGTTSSFFPYSPLSDGIILMVIEWNSWVLKQSKADYAIRRRISWKYVIPGQAEFPFLTTSGFCFHSILHVFVGYVFGETFILKYENTLY